MTGSGRFPLECACALQAADWITGSVFPVCSVWHDECVRECTRVGLDINVCVRLPTCVLCVCPLSLQHTNQLKDEIYKQKCTCVDWRQQQYSYKVIPWPLFLKSSEEEQGRNKLQLKHSCWVHVNMLIYLEHAD